MPSAMQGLLKQSFTLAQFKDYLAKEVAPRMSAWRPRGVVLHNTGKMVWPGFDARGVKLTPAQRIDNISVTWVANNFPAAPHLMISPDGMIHTVWPLWLKGTHSPSWNDTFWGVEMVGDFDFEPFFDTHRLAVTGALQALYAMLGHQATPDTFHLHKEDPKTTHKRCPGVNCGTKETWLARINETTASTSPVTTHAHKLIPSPFLKTTLKAMEGFREKPYLLKGIWHIGYGFRDGFRGMHINANSTMTLAQADVLFDESVAIQADTIQQMIHVPLRQNQLDALQLLAWNIGLGAMETSTVIRKLNLGDYAGAGAAFELWNKARLTPTSSLEFSKPLADRRVKERAIFDGKPQPVTVVLAKPPVVATHPLPEVAIKPPASPAQTVPHAPSPMAPKPALTPPATKPSLAALPWWARFLIWFLNKNIKGVKI